MKFFREAEIEYTFFSVRWWGECWAGSLTFMDGIGYDVCRALCCVENIERFSLMTRYPKEVDFFMQCLLLTTHEFMSCEEKLEQETTLGKVAQAGADVQQLLSEYLPLALAKIVQSYCALSDFSELEEYLTVGGLSFVIPTYVLKK